MIRLYWVDPVHSNQFVLQQTWLVNLAINLEYILCIIGSKMSAKVKINMFFITLKMFSC